MERPTKMSPNLYSMNDLPKKVQRYIMASQQPDSDTSTGTEIKEAADGPRMQEWKLTEVLMSSV